MRTKALNPTFSKGIICIDFHAIISKNVEKLVAKSTDIAFDFVEIILSDTLSRVVHLSLHEISFDQLAHYSSMPFLILIHLLRLLLINKLDHIFFHQKSESLMLEF